MNDFFDFLDFALAFAKEYLKMVSLFVLLFLIALGFYCLVCYLSNFIL